MRRKRKQQSSEDEANWMTTYSDLVTLLLTFFVLLFSMATIEDQKFNEIKKSLKSSFVNWSGGDKFDYNDGEDIIKIIPDSNPQNNDQNIVDNAIKDIKKTYTSEEIAQAASEMLVEKAEAVKSDMQDKINNLGLADFISVVREEHNIVLRINSIILFDLGRAEVKDSGQVVLKDLSELLHDLDNEILIQGHTDDLPISTVLFPSNWELSTKRATNVAVYLIDECSMSADKLTATGNGEFKPIYPNNSYENRQKNRRIDIVIAQNYWASNAS